MSGRTQKDSLVSFGKRNVPRVKWETAIADNLPGGAYPYLNGKYIVREELQNGESIVRIWNSYSEELSSYQDSQLKFLVASKNDLCWKQTEPGRSLPSKAVLVDTSTQPNIYIGRDNNKEVGTVVKNAETGLYKLFMFSKSGMTKTDIATENYEVLCTK